MARLVLVSLALIMQIVSAGRMPPRFPNQKIGLNPPYPLPLKGEHKSSRRDANIQYDRMCNATGYGR